MSITPEELPQESEWFADWIATYHYDHFVTTAETLPLRQDTLTVMAYTRDHKVTGTASTGNMPLKHIRAVTAEFVVPPVLDHVIGDEVRKLRTEYDVWPLLYIHILLEGAGLLVTPQGEEWYLTETGEHFFEVDPLLQLLTLFRTWWFRVDWHIASHHDVDYPETLWPATQALLLQQPIGRWLDFEDFAATLIRRSGLLDMIEAEPGSRRWEVVHQYLMWDVRQMVIDRLVDFGSADVRFPQNARPIAQVEAFKLRWLSRALVEGLSL